MLKTVSLQDGEEVQQQHLLTFSDISKAEADNLRVSFLK